MGLFQVSLSVCCTSRSHNKGIPHASYWASSAKYWASLGSTTAHPSGLPAEHTENDTTGVRTAPHDTSLASHKCHRRTDMHVHHSQYTAALTTATSLKRVQYTNLIINRNCTCSDSSGGMQPSHVAVLSCLIVHTPTNQPTKQPTDRPTNQPPRPTTQCKINAHTASTVILLLRQKD